MGGRLSDGTEIIAKAMGKALGVVATGIAQRVDPGGHHERHEHLQDQPRDARAHGAEGVDRQQQAA